MAKTLNLADAARRRALEVIDQGHKPNFVPGSFVPRNDRRENPPARPGIAAECSCGWTSARAYASKNGAVAVFLWHLEEVRATRSA